jgi:hypothetical protein
LQDGERMSVVLTAFAAMAVLSIVAAQVWVRFFFRGAARRTARLVIVGGATVAILSYGAVGYRCAVSMACTPKVEAATSTMPATR